MTTVRTDLSALEASLRAGFQATLQDRAKAAQSAAPRRTGRFAASIRANVNPDGLSGSVSADVPYAGALEHGANVGSRRGPHMRAEPSITPAMASFGDVLADKLREANR
jgi:hypothetical protein